MPPFDPHRYDDIDLDEDFDDPSADNEMAEINVFVEEQLKKLEAHAKQAGEVMRLPRSTKLLTEVPAHLKYKEEDIAHVVAPRVITERYSGRDGSTGGAHYAGPKNSRPTDLTVISHSGEDTRVCTFGYGIPGPHSELLEVALNEDTQYPSLTILINRGRDKNILEAMIFASELADFEASAVNDNMRTELFKESLTVQFRCKLNDGGHVIWRGISQDMIMDIARKRSSPNLVVDEDTDWEEVVDQLSFANEVVISCLIHGPRPLESSLSYFTELMRTTIRHGNFWFWKLGPGMEQDTRSPPRWLVTKWWPIHDEDGEVVKAIPYAWAPLNRPSVWPDAKTRSMYHSWIEWERESTRGIADI